MKTLFNNIIILLLYYIPRNSTKAGLFLTYTLDKFALNRFFATQSTHFRNNGKFHQSLLHSDFPGILVQHYNLTHIKTLHKRTYERITIVKSINQLITMQMKHSNSLFTCNINFHGVLEQMLKQLRSRMDNVESYKVDIPKEYLEHLAEY